MVGYTLTKEDSMYGQYHKIWISSDLVVTLQRKDGTHYTLPSGNPWSYSTYDVLGHFNTWEIKESGRRLGIITPDASLKENVRKQCAMLLPLQPVLVELKRHIENRIKIQDKIKGG